MSNSTTLPNPIEAISASFDALNSELSAVRLELAEAKANTGLTGTLSVSVNGTATGSVTGARHAMLPTLIKLASARLPILLVGSAGTGKTHAAEQVATALGVPFYAISIGAQTSKSDIMGYMSATGSYISTSFRQAFEHGGVLLFDELDAGNANVLTQMNGALSSDYCAFPDSAKMVKKHPDFIFIGTANTFGLGASRQYVGRNQLDAATLDRFATCSFDIDEKLEYLLSGASSSDTANRWLSTVRKVRSYVESEGIRALVTPRATYKGATMLDAGMEFDFVLNSTILSGMSTDKHKYVTEIATSEFGNAPVTTGFAIPELAVNPSTGIVEKQAVELTSSPF